MNFKSFSKRVASLCLSLFLLLGLLGLSVVPPQIQIDSHQVLSFGATDTVLVVEWADGVIATYDLNSGKLKSHYQLPSPSKDFLLSTPDLPLLATLHVQTPTRTLIISDPTIGKIISQVKVGESTEIESFTPDHKFLNCYSEDDDMSVCKMEIATGKLLFSKLSDEYVFATWRAISPDGQSILFANNQSLKVMNAQGHEKWAKTQPEQTTISYDLSIPQPNGPYISAFMDNGEEKGSLQAITLESGKILWDIPAISFSAFRAISPDATHIVLNTDGKTQLQQPHIKKITELSNLPTEIDAVFSTSGKTLVCMPRLRIIHEDKDRQVITEARTAQHVFVLSVGDGKTVAQFDIQKPQVLK